MSIAIKLSGGYINKTYQFNVKNYGIWVNILQYYFVSQSKHEFKKRLPSERGFRPNFLTNFILVFLEGLSCSTQSKRHRHY